MPTHAPYRNPLVEFLLWLVWLAARALFALGRGLRALWWWLDDLAEAVAAAALRWQRALVEDRADHPRSPTVNAVTLPMALLIALMTGLLAWIVVLAVLA